MSAQMKQFLDTLGGMWMAGELEDKATGIFTSTGTIHGGQESTILTAMVPLLHLGMIFVGTPYGQNPQILVTDGIGGSPYGPATLAGADGSRQPVEAEGEEEAGDGDAGGQPHGRQLTETEATTKIKRQGSGDGRLGTGNRGPETGDRRPDGRQGPGT